MWNDFMVFIIPRILTYLHTYLLTYLHTYLFTYLLTYPMEQSPSKTNRFSASQEISNILWNTKDHYPIHKFLPPVSILSQLHPVHSPTSQFLKVHLNIILPSTPGSPKWSLSLRFSPPIPVHASPLPHTRYMLHTFHFSPFYQPHNIGRGVQNIKPLIL